MMESRTRGRLLAGSPAREQAPQRAWQPSTVYAATSPSPSIHAGAWTAWLGAVVAVLAITRNPFYLFFVLAWIGLTTGVVNRVAATQRHADLGLPPVRLSPITFGLFVVTLSALFNGLNVHVGATVLFRLPGGWPLIGGPITLEAVVYGALNGLALTGLFAAFLLLNRVVPVRSLVRLAPRAFYPVAVVVTIAVTFVPSTVRQFGEIRAAQAIRGHRVRGVRSWLPLIMPLLIGGLERALQLAEAMVARGFAATETVSETVSDALSGTLAHTDTLRDTQRTAHSGTQRGIEPGSAGGSLVSRIVLIGGMVSLLAGMLLHLVWRITPWGPLLLAVGAFCVGWVVWQVGRGRRHTTYRPQRWQLHDTLVCGGAVITLVAFLFDLPGLNRESVFYYPYPALAWPQLDMVRAVCTWGLLPPAFILLRTLRRDTEGGDTDGRDTDGGDTV